MGLTYKKKDDLEKLFEEFAIDPDKKGLKEATNQRDSFSVNIEEATVTMKDNSTEDTKKES